MGPDAARRQALLDAILAALRGSLCMILL
jgi:hypothetical protein